MASHHLCTYIFIVFIKFQHIYLVSLQPGEYGTQKVEYETKAYMIWEKLWCLNLNKMVICITVMCSGRSDAAIVYQTNFQIFHFIYIPIKLFQLSTDY